MKKLLDEWCNRVRAKQRFSLIELLVVIAIISILASMLLPALNNAKAAARKAVCISQQRQIASAFHSYASDYSHWVMPTNGWGTYGWRTNDLLWVNWLGEYTNSPDLLPEYYPGGPKDSWFIEDQWANNIFVCPDYTSRMGVMGNTGLKNKFLGGYGKNRRLPPNETKDEDWGNAIVGSDWVAQYKTHGNFARIKDSSERILIGDGNGNNGDLATYWQALNYDTYEIDKYRHSGGSVFVYTDGHTKWMRAEEIVRRANNEHGNTGFDYLFRAARH